MKDLFPIHPTPRARAAAVHRPDFVGPRLPPPLPPDPAPREGIIYFLRAGDFIKIGFATSVQQRRRMLQTGNPERLELIGWTRGTKRAEHDLHHGEFAKLRTLGEWFRSAPELLAYIEAVTPVGEPGEVVAPEPIEFECFDGINISWFPNAIGCPKTVPDACRENPCRCAGNVSRRARCASFEAGLRQLARHRHLTIGGR